MDTKISGSGSIQSGEYDDILISGSGKAYGPVRCKNLRCSGSAMCTGSLEVSERASVSGSLRIDGELHAQELRVCGSGKTAGPCTVHGAVDISGSFRCGALKAGELQVSGSLHADSVESEEARIGGKITCPGLFNAESITLTIDGADSEVGSIGGSSIRIKRKRGSILGSLFSRGRRPQLTVLDSIEGDEITLEYVRATAVIGRVVKIGAGCHIDRVQYSESIDIDPSAEVGGQTQA